MENRDRWVGSFVGSRSVSEPSWKCSKREADQPDVTVIFSSTSSTFSTSFSLILGNHL